jgi:homoserine/homoserine lactone efflux protein
MDLSTWLYFTWVAVVLSLSPGPAVLFVLGQGLRQGAIAALFATCGILAANAAYFALSGFGLSAVLLGSPAVFAVLKWGGVGYLAFLGCSALTSPGGRLTPTATGRASHAAVFRAGFLLQAGNPKALVFFTSILPPFLATDAAAWSPGWQIAVLGVTSVIAEFLVLAGYGFLAQAVSHRFADPRVARWLDRMAGIMLLGVAVWVACRGE